MRPHLLLNQVTGAVYIATRFKRDGKSGVCRVTEKYDVTLDVHAIAEQLGYTRPTPGATPEETDRE